MKHKKLHTDVNISNFILSIRITINGEKVFALSQANNIRMICTSTFKVLKFFPNYISTFNDQYFCINAAGTIVAGLLIGNNKCLKIHQDLTKRKRVLYFGSKNVFHVSHFVDRFGTFVYATLNCWVEFVDYRNKKKKLKYRCEAKCNSFAYSKARRVLVAGLSIGICVFQFQRNGMLQF